MPKPVWKSHPDGQVLVLTQRQRRSVQWDPQFSPQQEPRWCSGSPASLRNTAVFRKAAHRKGVRGQPLQGPRHTLSVKPRWISLRGANGVQARGALAGSHRSRDRARRLFLSPAARRARRSWDFGFGARPRPVPSSVCQLLEPGGSGDRSSVRDKHSDVPRSGGGSQRPQKALGRPEHLAFRAPQQ